MWQYWSRNLFPHYKELIFSRCCCAIEKGSPHPHVTILIMYPQARATRTCAPVHCLTAIKWSHAQAWKRTLIDKIMGLTPTTSRLTAISNTSQQLASSWHISVKEIFSNFLTCNFNSKQNVTSLFCSKIIHLLIYFSIANMFYYILKLISWLYSGDLHRRGRRTFPTSGNYKM